MEYWGILIPFAEYTSSLKKKEGIIELLIPLGIVAIFFLNNLKKISLYTSLLEKASSHVNGTLLDKFSLGSSLIEKTPLIEKYVSILINSGAILIGFLINFLILLHMISSEKSTLWNQVIDRTIAGVRVTLKRYVSMLLLVAIWLQLINVLFSMLSILFNEKLLMSLILVSIALYVFLVSIFVLMRMGWLLYEVFTK